MTETVNPDTGEVAPMEPEKQARWSIDYETDARLPYGVARDGVTIAGFARREWAEAFIELARAKAPTWLFTRLVLAYDSTP